jgi:hypothetical protein
MVDMLIGEYGEGAIGRLADAYRGGASDAEALRAATGVSADELFADFYDEFGADEPKAVEPAPILPSDVRKPGAAAGASQPRSPANPGTAPAGGGLGWVVLVVVVLVISGAGATWWATRRVRRPPAGEL